VLTRLFPFLHPDSVGPVLSSHLRQLANDLERIRDHEGPTSEELENAPLLSGWRLLITSLGVRLVGNVERHPRLGSGEVTTSQVWVADPEGKWARTISRFYKLGDPARAAADTDDEDNVEFDGGL
jgi:hypothetical protein